ncbi:hypothetical protein EVAR_49198_1 [Eumeta japonica]|uniref:RNase H type-1 domain-containing protein n=1 Tax=Eumeta variegata TaxID=151549 RepID=A0A4C1XRR9_EUMVA|nr:hypothetical protein EVAR_49198_1 [Eumeta japonica]
MVLTKKLKYDNPVVYINGDQISSVAKIRLLSRIIDQNLTFTSLVAKLACKSISTEAELRAKSVRPLRNGETERKLNATTSIFCTVFQEEIVALQIAIRRVKKDKDRLVNVFSDFKLGLELLSGPRTYHPLAHKARRDISEIVAEGRAVRYSKLERMPELLLTSV